MPTLTATGPVEVENYDLGKRLELPLVEFTKHNQIIVELNDSYLTMTYDSQQNRYQGTNGTYRFHCMGPRFTATSD